MRYMEHNTVSEEEVLAIEKAVKEGVLLEATTSGALRWNQVMKQNIGEEKRVKYRTFWHGTQLHLWCVTKPAPDGRLMRSSFISVLVGEDKRVIKDPAMKDLLKAVLDKVRDSEDGPGASRIIMPKPGIRKKHIAFPRGGRKTAATEALEKGARRKGIGFTDIIVLDNKERCRDAAHEHVWVVISMSMLDRNGREVLKQIPAQYCPQCNAFMIKYGVFRAYRAQGFVFPCQIMDYKTFVAGEYQDYNSYDMSKESIFMRYGYIVNRKFGISEKQRAKIIYNMLSRNVLSKDEMRAYIDTLIASDEYSQQEKAAWSRDRSLLG